MDYESNMEVGLAAQNLFFIPASPRRLREGEARAGYRPGHAEAVALALCQKVSRALSSCLRAFLASARGSSFCVRSEASPNKAFKNVRCAHWDALSARPLTNR